MDLSISLESFEVEEPAEISLESLENELQSNRKQINELSRVSQDLAKRGMVNRGVAESIATMKDRFPSLESHFEKYPVRSYTESFSRTNLKVTQEGLVGGMISAVVNALKKIASWISGAFKWLWDKITGKKATVEKATVVAEKTEEVLVVAKSVDLVKVYEDAVAESNRQLEETIRQVQAEAEEKRKVAEARARAEELDQAARKAESDRIAAEMEAGIKKLNEKQEWLDEQLKELKADEEIGNFLEVIGKDINQLQTTVYLTDKPIDIDGYKYHYPTIMAGLIKNLSDCQQPIYDNANRFAQLTTLAPTALEAEMKKWDVAIDNYLVQYSPKKDPDLMHGETRFSLVLENIDKLTAKALQGKSSQRMSMEQVIAAVKHCRQDNVTYLRGLKGFSKGVGNEMQEVSKYVSKTAMSIPQANLTKEQSELILLASTLLQKTVSSVHRGIKVLEIYSDERVRFIKKVSSYAKKYVEKLSELERKGMLPDKYKSDFSKIIGFSKLKTVGR